LTWHGAQREWVQGRDRRPQRKWGREWVNFGTISVIIAFTFLRLIHSLVFFRGLGLTLICPSSFGIPSRSLNSGLRLQITAQATCVSLPMCMYVNIRYSTPRRHSIAPHPPRSEQCDLEKEKDDPTRCSQQGGQRTEAVPLVLRSGILVHTCCARRSTTFLPCAPMSYPLPLSLS